MAGDWFPVRDDLCRDLVVIKMARQLCQIRAQRLSAFCPQVVRFLSASCPQNVHDDSAERPTVVPDVSQECLEYLRSLSSFERCLSEILGTLVRLWGFADEQTEDGLLQGIEPEDLSVVIGGEPDAWGCIVQGGWLVRTVNGLQVPNYDKWLSNSAKRRAKDRDRKRLDRRESTRANRVRNVSEVCPQNVRNETDEKRTTEQNRTEDINTPISPFNQGSEQKPKTPLTFEPAVANCFDQLVAIRRQHYPHARDPVRSEQTLRLLRDRLDSLPADDILAAWRWAHSSDHSRAKHLRRDGPPSLQQFLGVSEHKGPYLDEYVDFAANEKVVTPRPPDDDGMLERSERELEEMRARRRRSHGSQQSA